ncbi:MAG: hypothetical protein ABIH66_14705 [bacterium]
MTKEKHEKRFTIVGIGMIVVSCLYFALIWFTGRRTLFLVIFTGFGVVFGTYALIVRSTLAERLVALEAKNLLDKADRKKTPAYIIAGFIIMALGMILCYLALFLDIEL